MIRTLCTLTPGTKADGTRCLKGKLSRAIVTSDSAGVERRYPAGTPLVLSKGRDGQTYSLLAILSDDAAEESATQAPSTNRATPTAGPRTSRREAQGADPVRQQRARRNEQTIFGAGGSPF